MDERGAIQDFLNKHSSCQAGGKRKNFDIQMVSTKLRNKKVAIKLKQREKLHPKLYSTCKKLEKKLSRF